jgi:hypothetical protein
MKQKKTASNMKADYIGYLIRKAISVFMTYYSCLPMGKSFDCSLSLECHACLPACCLPDQITAISTVWVSRDVREPAGGNSTTTSTTVKTVV